MADQTTSGQMDPTDGVQKKSTRPRRVVAAVTVLGVIAIVAVSIRSSQTPVEVSAAGGVEVEVHWPTCMPLTCAHGRCQP